MSRQLLRFSCVMIVLGLLAACQTPRPTATALPTRTVTARPPTLTPRPTLPPAPNTSANDPTSSASIRLLNAINAPLDIYLEGGLIASGLGFGIPTGTLTPSAGQYTLRVFTAGSNFSDTTPLLNQSITLTKDQSVVIVLTGTPAKPAFNLFDTNTAPVAAGQVRLTLIHLLADTKAITVSSDAQTLATMGGFGKTTDANGVSLNTVSLKFEADGKTLLTQPVGFADRQAYLLFLIGTPDAPKAVIFGDQTRRESQVRAVNVSDKIGAVDIVLGDQAVAKGLAFGKSGTWLHLRSGNYDLKVFKAGAPSDAKPLYTSQIALPADAPVDVILYGAPDALQHRLVTEDLSPTEADYVRMIVFNTISDANMLQSIRSGLVIDSFSMVRYGENSPTVSMHAGFAEMAFRSDDLGTPRVLENKLPLDLKAGTAYIYFVTGTSRATEAVLISTDVGTVAAAPTATVTNMPLLRARVINAMAEDVNIDVTINGKALFSGVRQGRGTNAITLPPQVATLKLSISGSTDALIEIPMNASGNQQLMLIAVGTSKSARLLQVIENTQPTTTGSVVRVIQGAPDAPRLRADTIIALSTPVSGSSIDRSAATQPPSKGVELVPFLDFSNVSQARVLSPGIYTFVFHSAIDSSLLGTLPNVTIEGDKRYDLVLLPGKDKTVSPVVIVSSDPTQ